jgi:hypothetical protein
MNYSFGGLNCEQHAAERKRSGALAIVAVLAVTALTGLAEFRRRAVAPVRLRQVQADELRAIKLIFLPSKDAGDAAGNSCKNFHGGGYCEISANCTSNCSQAVHKEIQGSP